MGAVLTRPISRHASTDPWRLHFSTRDLINIVGKGLEVPRDGWHASDFARQGRLLMLTMARIAKLTQRRAVPYVARKIGELFDQQTREIIRLATSSTRSAGPQGEKRSHGLIEIILPQHEALWMRALEEVMDEAGVSIRLQMTPPIQSVMAQSYSRTSILLGQDALPETNPRISRAAQGIAEKITRINETTRTQLEKVIRDSVTEGRTVTEVSQALRNTMDGLGHSRSLTIARTELNNAWTQGSVASFQESGTVTHVSVIGCEAREPNSPHFRGESTCNIEDVPVSELNELMAVGWHPNHTGTLVPSGFTD